MAHKRKQGANRPEGDCTSCGQKLPENKKGWGLNWNEGSGMCAKCLYDIRKSIGYFEGLQKKESQKESQKKGTQQ